MPQIIPIRDMKKTSELSELCHRSKEPVFITKNGYGDMVIMSMETYERIFGVRSIPETMPLSEKSLAKNWDTPEEDEA